MIRPSECDRCVPVVTHSDYVTEYAHQPDCIHARKDDSK